MGSLSLLQGIFSTQGSNPGLPHCRRILYQLSHKGNPINASTLLNVMGYPFCNLQSYRPTTLCEEQSLISDDVLSKKPWDLRESEDGGEGEEGPLVKRAVWASGELGRGSEGSECPDSSEEAYRRGVMTLTTESESAGRNPQRGKIQLSRDTPLSLNTCLSLFCWLGHICHRKAFTNYKGRYSEKGLVFPRLHFTQSPPQDLLIYSPINSLCIYKPTISR